MTMCVASCSNYEQGWFTAYRRLAEEHPDLVVHLGDYQYEYGREDQVASGDVREHVGPETVTLANYRQRYAQYKTDPGGYVRAHFTADEMRADFRVVRYVSRPGASVHTGASFVVPERAAELHAL